MLYKGWPGPEGLAEEKPRHPSFQGGGASWVTASHRLAAGLWGRGCSIVRKCEPLLLQGDALFAKHFLVTFNLGATGCKFTNA